MITVLSLKAVPNQKVENTEVKNNAIYGNNFGLANLNNFDVIVDATLNWWGDASARPTRTTPAAAATPSATMSSSTLVGNAAMTVEGSNTVVTVVKPNKATNVTGSTMNRIWALGRGKIEALLIRQHNIYPTTAFGHSIKLNDIASCPM